MIKPKIKTVRQSGFTIVELLIVIVVIGILAAITVIAYTGINQQASAAALKSDLNNSQTILSLDKAKDNKFPASIEEANDGKGLKLSPDTIYEYSVDNDANPPTFCLTARNDTQAFHVTQDSALTTGVCPGHAEPSGGQPGGGTPDGYTDDSPKTAGVEVNSLDKWYVEYYDYVIDKNTEPFASGFPWLAQNQANSENITDVKAWIGSKPVAIVADGWSAYNESNSFGLKNYDNHVTVGDGSNDIMYYFFQNGTITATIDGVPGNTFYLKDLAWDMDLKDPNAPPPIDCGPYVDSFNFNSSGPAERSSFMLTNNESWCQFSTTIRYENESIQSGLGTPTLSGVKDGCWWNYTGCLESSSGSLMWLQGDAGIRWVAKQNTDIIFKYKNGASYVNFSTIKANVWATFHVPGSSSYDTDSTYDPDKPEVYFAIKNDINSDYGSDDYSNDCHTRFIAGTYGGSSPTPGPYGSYVCPGATQSIDIIADYNTDTDTSGLSDGFRLMAENGGQITFTTTENNTVTVRIDPSDFFAVDPNAPTFPM